MATGEPIGAMEVTTPSFRDLAPKLWTVVPAPIPLTTPPGVVTTCSIWPPG
ncbi:unknown protein [Microcystis aeruginosa NIES-843]|uniref:Uncharacterized protein n=1 Tax=Microcystis aeruginosa (strain NIES-843 / IAM M-2473) TaxID=449447 RepID=B0JMB8_MICAN|nr:unknown protein [Microcystis aeruginosa NIES-843]